MTDNINDRSWILVNAHHCAPNMGSEHAVGWNLVSRLSKEHPILLVTQDNEFRSSIEREIAMLQAQGSTIKAYFVRHSSRTDGRKNNLRLLYYITYRNYQKNVLKLASSLSKTHNIAAVHQLTIVGFREPGFLWKLGIPFIWGPVGGLVYAPRILFADLSLKMRIFQLLRNALTFLQFNFSPRVRAAYQAALTTKSFVAATPDIGQMFQKRYGGEYTWIPETGSNPQPILDVEERRPSSSSKFRILWLGGLLDIKPLGILLDAVSQIPNHRDRILLTVVGDGDSRSKFEQHAKMLGIASEFVGWVSHADAKEKYKQADVFVLLSIKDLTTNVVFESLAAGVPVVCLDHHGYSAIIDETCGKKIPLLPPQELRDRIAHELIYLNSNPRLHQSLRTGSIARAEMFTWDKNAEAIGGIYKRIKSSRG